jgi:hypothetical protein
MIGKQPFKATRRLTDVVDLPKFELVQYSKGRSLFEPDFMTLRARVFGLALVPAPSRPLPVLFTL